MWPLAGTASRILGIDEIVDIAQRVFGSGSETIGQVAGRYSLPVLGKTMTTMIDAIAGVTRELPEVAFQAQPDDIDGSDVWSAGEIISHLAEMEVAALPFWELASGRTLPDPPPTLVRAIRAAPATRDDCCEIIEAIRDHNVATFAAIADTCTGEERAVHFAIGRVSVKEAILGSSLHLADHYHQLRSLMAPAVHD